MSRIETIMRTSPVIPVIVAEGSLNPQAIAEAFVRGGLRVLEVTLRTPQALDWIRAMSKVEGAIVGAGTVLNGNQLRAAVDAGSQFIVSPGLTDKLGHAAIEAAVPFLPGVASAADIMRGLDMGLDRFKFFPAETSGGRPALKALSGPFGDIRFCPTGGITLDSAPDWLAMEPVLCVGGSWLLKKDDTDLAVIEERARAAAALQTS
ncbi:bifunctional 4-hydroxy-2-oxoglutarate aldolase/2-dehydro-3-deoxy-phosphogluconate aldolase [Sphingomonas piscis]|uniref:2-dehydro-3-deoxy-phosphogluconate aldolase n=1 Tax=Sphingomonas piscis TaxID=2714943 RepID=A0A6G7YNH4_9SPHN|nr:bifunctional 4-hydroxy-2-oxoglutarate aldolase/2-dehydro-3-deoxy-phosphogluconate aldolase [Sphingomonas piscis]QIK78289.1 bifunctional 4-hydroxy-2-oxoglutarate aldolase/2-dehydro-3-deoxy-phosphogluconate aldolase [Sphingomonas piscis]